MPSWAHLSSSELSELWSQIYLQRQQGTVYVTMANAVKSHWKVAAKKTRYLKDPWEDVGFENFPEILVTRHIYNPKTKAWWNDNKQIKIKMESKVMINFQLLIIQSWCNIDRILG